MTFISSLMCSCLHHLCAEVEKELEQMESGIISKIDKPTPWCAGMVVANTRNGCNSHMCQLLILKLVCLYIHVGICTFM